MKVSDIYSAIKSFVDAIMEKVNDIEATDWVNTFFEKVADTINIFKLGDKKIG